MSRHRDFDAFQAEQKKEPVTFTFKGITFELPPSMPASVGLQMVRMTKKYGTDEETLQKDVPQSELMELVFGIFGDQLQTLLNTGIDVETLGEISKWLIQMYSGKVEEEAKN